MTRGFVGRADVVLALGVMGILAMLLLPMPTWVIDLGVAANLSAATVLLATALYAPRPLAFSSFPTLLLLTTLYRLALNVSSTRLILLQADAGRVIEAFGSVVVRGDYAVGGLVFAMLTAVQFVVVARGAERIAEVSARFSLDALPGKQIAIEAELRAGQLGSAEGRRAREQLARESELLGALDGAMKFVKGDAIAGLVIAGINAFGGVGIGVLRRELSLADSAQRYGLLAIGDALASQLPSLLSAAAAGVLVTRMATRDADSSLAQTIARETLGDTRVLVVAGAVLAVLALAPGLPSAPFALLALCLFALAWRAARNQARVRDQGASISLHTGSALGIDTQKTLRALHAGLSEQLGLALPALRIVHDPKLPAGARSWRFLELAVVPAPTADAAVELDALVRAHARRLVTLDHVGELVERLALREPRLVREVVPARIGLRELSALLAALVDEGVSLTLLPRILEALAGSPPKGEGARLEYVRRALANELSATLAPGGELRVMRLSPEVEEAIADAIRPDIEQPTLALSPDLGAEIRGAIALAHAEHSAPKALLTSAEIRAHVRALVRSTSPDLPVISADQLTEQVVVTSLRMIGP